MVINSKTIKNKTTDKNIDNHKQTRNRKITMNSPDYLKKKILKNQKKKKSNIYNSSKTLYKNPRKL